MGFSKIKTWDNRESRRKNGRLQFENGRSWTRRMQELGDGEGNLKIKFEDGDNYKEVIVPTAFVQVVWDRFKEGQSIEDAISILGKEVPNQMKSRKARSP